MNAPARGISAIGLAFSAVIGVGCGDDPVRVDGPPPTILDVSPVTGTVGTEIRIMGNDFRSGAAVFVGDRQATLVDVSGGSEVFAFIPEGVIEGVTYDVEVRNTDGTKDKLPSAFTAVAPQLDFVNSATKPSGNLGSTVILEGDAFGDLQGSGTITFSNGLGGAIVAPIAAPDDWTNTFIVTTVPSGAQSGPVFVTTATGESNTLGFTVTQNAAFSPSTISWTDYPTSLRGGRDPPRRDPFRPDPPLQNPSHRRPGPLGERHVSYRTPSVFRFGCSYAVQFKGPWLWENHHTWWNRRERRTIVHGLLHGAELGGGPERVK
jgi:hypothetical protein